ncbi:MAG: LptF/LptG family permease [Bacteroides sp.]|nr:LptF/LptG family permease [Bacteroides sp.]MDD2645575.1 LptF/LptG family permease [Bacteroides sp.]MDD4054670.1 LptF/LptG family permease [Bacteroides sp.]MDD4720875.1 LptF/LptG family permease [Bacteroides sp.]NLI63388.1 YjgP/YjgQ family permease [Bacteroidales bacterium]
MLRLKKLDRFVIKSFVLLFIATFFICLFIFMMQFLWRFVDEMVGKGLEMNVLAEFFFYSALHLVPTSMPLAILLASLITFGNFGERYELLAMKSAGISLLEIMRPLIFFTLFLCGVSFVFQNNVGPHSQKKLYTLLISMKQKSPELDIPEGVFYDEVSGFNIFVKEKDRKTGLLYQVMLYDFSEGFDNAQIVVADTGKLEMTADKQHLALHLYSGELFSNLRAQNASSENVPYRRESFKEKHTLIAFDSDFNMADESIMSSQANSKNMRELRVSIDSLSFDGDSIGREHFASAMGGVYELEKNLSRNDSLQIVEFGVTGHTTDSLFNISTLKEKQQILNSAYNRAQSVGNDWNFKSYTLSQNDYNIRRHKTEWHNKITLSLACLIFFFIGAPLGAIIRKGGLGMPVVISVLIFIFYYVVDRTGYKMARDGKWILWMGMWLSTGVLAPIGVFLTYKSNNDSVILDGATYINGIKRFLGIKSTRYIMRKEVIIHDPNYSSLLEELRRLTHEGATLLSSKQLLKAPNYIQVWTSHDWGNQFADFNKKLELVIEQLANSKSHILLAALNKYPILFVEALRPPFKRHKINLAIGIFIPLGLFFYFRIWIFRVRLNKDLKKVLAVNEEIINLIEQNKI